MTKIFKGKRILSRQRAAAVLLSAGWLACPVITQATTYTWNGSSSSGFGFLSENDNWVGNVAPPTSGTSDLVFGSLNTRNFTPTLGSSYSINSLTFNSSALAFTINGGPLTINGGGLTDSSSNPQTLSGNIGIVLGAAQTWNISGSLTVSGDTLTNSSSNTLTKTGGGTLNLALSASGNSISALSLQGGTTQLTAGSMALSSGFGVSAATFNVSGGAVLNSAFPSIQAIDGGGSMTVTGAGSRWAGGGQVEVGASGVGSLTVGSGGSASAGTFLSLGEYSGGNGTVSITSGGTISAPITTIGFASGSTAKVTVDGAGSTLNASGFVALGGYGSVGGTGTLTITNGGAVITSQVNFESPTSSVNISGGSLYAGSLISLNNGLGMITLNDLNLGPVSLDIEGNSGTNVYSGSISGPGSLYKSNNSTQVLSGTNTFTGFVTVNGGTLNMSSGAATYYEVDSGATLILGSGNFGSAPLYAAAGGTIVYNTPYVSGGTLDGPGTHNVSSVGYFGGTSFSSDVTITPNSFTTFTGVTNAGNINFTGGNQFTLNGVSNAGGTLNISGTVFARGLNSSGIIEIYPGGALNVGTTLTLLGGSETYLGTSNAPGGTLSLNNESSLQLNGGLLVNFGTISGGTVYVNYAGLATGTGSYSSVVVNPGGTYLPGNYGIGSPPPTLGSPAAMIQPAASGSTTTSTPVTVTTGTTITVNTGDTLTLAGGLNAAGQSVTKLGGGTFIVAPFSATDLNVSGGSLQLSPSSSVLSITTLEIASSATLDLTSNSADISAGSLSAITALAKLGYANGAWNGSGGITSSTAAANSKRLTAVGAIQNNQSGAALYTASHLFEGIAPGAGDVLVKYTYYGDTNLDGKIDGSDYSRIDAAYLADKTNPANATGWLNGDFNYDGVINGSDYTLIDNAFNTQAAQLLDQAATPTAQLAKQSGDSPVPEPEVAMRILGAAGLLSRRRFRRNRNIQESTAVMTR